MFSTNIALHSTNVPLGVVERYMRFIAHQGQVLAAVVYVIAVNVMHYLSWLKKPAKFLLHKVDVLINASLLIGARMVRFVNLHTVLVYRAIWPSLGVSDSLSSLRTLWNAALPVGNLALVSFGVLSFGERLERARTLKHLVATRTKIAGKNRLCFPAVSTRSHWLAS